MFTSKQLELPAGWPAAAAALDASTARLARVTQVHGRVVRVLHRGRVTAAALAVRPDGDAIVSNEPGLVLAVMAADCVPILLADRKSGAAAAIHAGWRGTCARVAAEAVSTMARECGARPGDLVAAIGPSIGPDDYEVGDGLVDAFVAAHHDPSDIQRWFSRTGARPHLDLWGANRDQLIAAGLRPDRVHVCGLSTLSHPDVFESYRAAGDRAGRMAALVRVPEVQ